MCLYMKVVEIFSHRGQCVICRRKITHSYTVAGIKNLKYMSTGSSQSLRHVNNNAMYRSFLNKKIRQPVTFCVYVSIFIFTIMITLFFKFNNLTLYYPNHQNYPYTSNPSRKTAIIFAFRKRTLRLRRFNLIKFIIIVKFKFCVYCR